MSIVLAKKIGFCFGVKRAVAMAEEALEKKRPIYSFGSIIHNKEVVSALSKKGLKVIKDIGKVSRGTVIISSHGLSPKVVKKISERGLDVIDTTCPFVRKAQRIAQNLSRRGCSIVVVGDARHPEIRALVDFVSRDVFVVKNVGEAKKLRIGRADRVSIISQTTQSTENFLDVVKVISKKKPKELRVFNTICKDAEERQASARQLARVVDLMLIIGGRDSANTKRLYEVSSSILKDSHLVETEADLADLCINPGWVVGVASGASTPDWVIKKVVKKIQRKGLCN
ncbi:MAG: 4-hydroxy-3-methylbut-2-enyl diphosphate reductase [Candidatus Omnitrophota bacterium]|jgi:4-hydroxy-3-methylbut-2-enyl diphosphate reductase